MRNIVKRIADLVHDPDFQPVEVEVVDLTGNQVVEVYNKRPIEFSIADATWPVARYIGIYDAPRNGNILMFCEVTKDEWGNYPKPPNAGEHGGAGSRRFVGGLWECPIARRR